MAVQQGYGKMAGANSLVFAYDTGDTVNSYKGEPTENIIPDPTFTTQNWSTWGGRGADSWGYTTFNGQSVVYTDLSVNTGERHQLFRDITIPAVLTTYSMSIDVYVTADCDATAVFADQEYPFGVSYGGVGSYDLSKKETWQRLYRIRDNAYSTNPTNPQDRYRFYFGTSNTTGTKGRIYFKNAQLEVNTHPTQFTAGTRSATEGLKDLTGNSSIDLSNVGFDLDAQIDFDATDDVISINNPTLAEGPYTILMIVKPGTPLTPGGSGTGKPNGTNRHTPIVGPGPVWNPGIWVTSDYIRSHAQTQYVDSAIDWTTTTWQMIGMTYDGTNVQNIFGDQILPNAHTTGYNPPQPSELLIGAEKITGSSTSWDGSIAVVNVYNKVLTAAEIQANFNNYKTRFNIV